MIVLLCKLFYFKDGTLMLEIKFTAASVFHFGTKIVEGNKEVASKRILGEGDVLGFGSLDNA